MLTKDGLLAKFLKQPPSSVRREVNGTRLRYMVGIKSVGAMVGLGVIHPIRII